MNEVSSRCDLLSEMIAHIFASHTRESDRRDTNITMADKFKKVDKEFLLSDSSVNSYGFRLLTSGYQKNQFERNPIGYLMHERKDGVVVKWEDLKVDGDKILAKPVINLNNANGEKVLNDIENGFLNAASVGQIIALEWSDDESLKLTDQIGPTVTKWYNRECSLVDIPGNFNALVLLDKDENPINLADFTKSKIVTMKKIEITSAQLAAINLKAEATEGEFATVFNDLVAKAKKTDELQTQLTAATAKVGTLETEISTLKKGTSTKEVNDLIAAGVEAKKITVEVGEKLKKTYEGKPTELKDLIDSMTPYESVTGKIELEKEKKDKRYADLSAKSANALLESGEIEIVKKEFPDLYKIKMDEIKSDVKGSWEK